MNFKKFRYIRHGLIKIALLVGYQAHDFISTFMHIQNLMFRFGIGNIQNFDTSFSIIKHNFQSFLIIRNHFWTFFGFYYKQLSLCHYTP